MSRISKKKGLISALSNRFTAPEGVDLDGTNDYLSRASDLVGNADGKTFTCSLNFYLDASHTGKNGYFFSNGNTTDIGIAVIWQGGNEYLNIVARNSANTNILNVRTPDFTPSVSGWNSVQISVDLTNSANRSLYVNDVLASAVWSTYINDVIDFTKSKFYVAVDSQSTSTFLEGRLSHVFLDYTYRDLSIEANRRLFITADGKPAAGQDALNPILYLPITDAASAGVNLGTGGDFTVNGTIATSQRGPNQDNCVASEFDGVADYLSRTSISGASDSKTMTLNINVVNKDNQRPFVFFGAGNFYCLLHVGDGTGTYGGRLYIRDAAATPIIEVLFDTLLFGVANTLSISFDMSSATKRHFRVNNVEVNPTYNVYADLSIPFSLTSVFRIGADENPVFFKGDLGEFYLDNTYIDLSTDNPFWDAGANRPKPVAQVLEETGNTPLIALPIRADDAGKNLGTGGDFTVNSGPFAGARGGSEFWARSATGGGDKNNRLSTSGLGGTTNTSCTLVIATKHSSGFASNPSRVIQIGSNQVYLYSNTSESAIIQWGTNTATLKASTYTAGTWHILMISSNGSTTKAYWDNAVADNIPATPSNFNLSGAAYLLGSTTDFGFNGDVGFVYLNNSYIDFSQESERLKFVDALGYPIDLQPAIDAGDIPNPLIYMRFDDPDALGFNSGTGGDFTVNGTVTPGADVDPNA